MPQQTFANGEQLASVRAKLNGNAADVDARFGEVNTTLDLKADLVGGLVPSEQLPDLSPTELGAVFVQTDLGSVLPATNPGSGRPWVDTSGLMRVGAGAGGTIPYIPSPTPADGNVAMFDGLGGLKATGNGTFSGGVTARETLDLKHDYGWFTRIQAEPNLAETRFVNTYPGSYHYGGWSFRNGSTPEVEQAKISGDGVLLGQAYTTTFQSGYDRRSRMQTSGWLNGHGNFISYLDGSGGCVEIGATFRTQSDVNLGGYCAATNPNELVYFYIGSYGAELMTIAPATGRVGIGTTAPQYQLEIYKQGAFISLQQPVPGINGIRFGDGGTGRGVVFVDGVTGEMRHDVGYAGWGGFYSFYNNGAEHFHIHENGAIGMGQDPNYEYLGSRCTLRQNQNAITRHLVRNEDTGSSAGAEFTVNAYGNSWSLGMGSNTSDTGNSFYLGVDVSGGTATSKPFVVTTAGNVGIGTTTPTHKLQVLGAISLVDSSYITGGVAAAGYTSFLTASNTAQGVQVGALAVSSNYGYTAPTNGAYIEGRVGIGTTIPNSKLQISGSVGASNDFAGYPGYSAGLTPNGVEMQLNLNRPYNYSVSGPTYQGGLGFGLANACGIYSLAEFPSASVYYSDIRFYTTYWDGAYYNADRMVITSVGNIGIGTSTPVVKLDVAGPIKTSRLGTFGTYDSSQVQGIWALSEAHGIDPVANSFGGQYGIGYAYGNTGGAPFSGEHQIVYTQAGVVGATIGLGGTGYFKEKLGVGTTIPGFKLHVYGTDDNTTSGSLEVFNASDTSGAAALVAFRSATSRGYIGAFPAGSASFVYQDRVVLTSGSDAAGITIDATSVGQDIRYLIANAEKMRIASDGSVGIGTTSPIYKLDIQSTSDDLTSGSLQVLNTSDTANAAAMVALRSATSRGTLAAYPASYVSSVYADRIVLTSASDASGISLDASAAGQDIRFIVADVERMQVDSAGNVGVGTSAPTDRLTVGNGTGDTRIHSQSGSTYAVRVSNGVGNGGYHFGATASVATPDGVFCNHSGVERLRITDAGNLGVGSTNPTQRLEVGGTIKSTYSLGLLVSPAAADDSAYARYNNSGGSTYFGMDDIDGNSLSGTAYAAAINTPVAVVCVIGGVVRSTLNANGEYLNGDLVISGGGGFGRTVAVGVGGAVQHNSLAIFGHATPNYAPVFSLYRVSSRECALAVVGGDLCFANTGGFANYQDSTLLAASSLRLRSTGEVTTTSSFETQGATVGASNSWQAKSQDVASGYWSLASTNTGHGMQMHSAGYLDTTFGYATHSGSADPTVSDVASNSSLMWKNTTSGEVRHWVNDGGTMLKSAAYS